MTNGGSLIGLVSDIQVYNRLLSDEEAYRYMDCSEILSGDIAAWEDDQDWEMVGETVEMELGDICSAGGSIEERVMIMPARLNYQGRYLIYYSREKKFNGQRIFEST